MTKSTITKKLLTKKNIFLLGLSALAGGAIIATPLLVFANLELKNPRIDAQNQAKSISFISIKDKYLNANSDYLDLKKKLLNDDNTKKTDIDLTDFFDFYQTNNSSIPVNFSTDHNWKPFKLEIFDIKPDDNEQTFEVFWRVSQKLDDNKIATSDLFKQKVAYNYVPDYSLSNFSTYSEDQLKKLRPYTNSEVNFSFKKELTKLISVEDFQKEVNSAKDDNEAGQNQQNVTFNISGTPNEDAKEQLKAFVEAVNNAYPFSKIIVDSEQIKQDLIKFYQEKTKDPRQKQASQGTFALREISVKSSSS